MKYKFEGIGEASAAVVMAALASNPSTTFLTQGILGKIVFFFCKLIFMWFASLGLIALNVGSAKIQTIVENSDYEKSWDNAEEMIRKIQGLGRELTDEEKMAIDKPVMDAFRKFGRIGKRLRGNEGDS